MLKVILVKKQLENMSRNCCRKDEKHLRFHFENEVALYIGISGFNFNSITIAPYLEFSISIISPNRINLPSPRSQWQKMNGKKGK